MDDRFTYDSDFLVWTETQARALRELARTRADLPNELDLEHVAEEIEDMGKSELNAVKSQIRNIMIHLIKVACEPDGRAVPHWKSEIRAFHMALLDRLTPAMASRLDLATSWRRARSAVLDDCAEGGHTPALTPPRDCPFDPADFTGERIDVDTLFAKISSPG